MTRFARQRQAGFGILVYLLAAAAVIAALGTLYAVVDGRGYDRGVNEVTAAYAKRDNKALKDAITAKEAAEKRAKGIEDQRTADAAEAGRRYQEGLADGKKELDSALARARAGQRLRDPGRTGCAPVGAAGPVPAPSPGGRGGDGQAGAELSQPAAGVLSAEASDFLIRLAGEANDVVKQLASCQAVIAADRK